MKPTQLIFNITSEQPEALQKFYQDVVGLEMDPVSGCFLIGESAMFTIDGHSETHGRAKEPHRYLFSFKVDDVMAERRADGGPGRPLHPQRGHGVLGRHVFDLRGPGWQLRAAYAAPARRRYRIGSRGALMRPPEFGFAIEYVSDIEAATRFYADVIGLEVERTHPTFVQFQSFAIATDAPLGGVDERELYWLVEDAEKTYRDLRGDGRGHTAAAPGAVRQGLRRQGTFGPPVLSAGAGAGSAERGGLVVIEADAA